MASKKINVYLEVGMKRTFAGALDWPGWCRSGSDEESALQALYEYAPRYARVLSRTRLGFQAPASPSVFAIVERLKGNATTDFGAPALAPASDEQPVDEAEMMRLEKIFRACWRALDAAVESAQGKILRTGPRGGGRDVDGILHHVLEADAGYLNSLGWKIEQNDRGNPEKIRKAILSGLRASTHGEIPERGPRGGLRWSPRYYSRRAVWHTLDHVWEIEDRVQTG